MKRLLRFIQRFKSPKRWFCAGTSPDAKVRVAAKLFLIELLRLRRVSVWLLHAHTTL